MKYLLKLTLTLCVVVTTIFYGFSNNQINAADTLGGLYDELAALKATIAEADSKIDNANNSIESKRTEINRAASAVIAKQEEISLNQIEITRLSEDIEKKGVEIADLLVYYQLNEKSDETLEFIVDAGSLTESIYRESVVDLLTEKSDQKITEFIAMQDNLQVLNDQLAVDITSLNSMQEALKKEIDSLKVNINDLSSEKVSVADQVKDIEKTIKYYEGMKCEKNEKLEACEARNRQVVPNSSGFTSPMEEGYITSWMGWRTLGGYTAYHAGTDMAIGYAAPIYASAPGTVSKVSYDGSRGNHVYISHLINGQKYTTCYLHLASWPNVSVGDAVTVDTVLGKMGTTGDSTGPHLHFEIHRGYYGVDFFYNPAGSIDIRNFLSYPSVGTYWSGRNR